MRPKWGQMEPLPPQGVGPSVGLERVGHGDSVGERGRAAQGANVAAGVGSAFADPGCHGDSALCARPQYPLPPLRGDRETVDTRFPPTRE